MSPSTDNYLNSQSKEGIEKTIRDVAITAGGPTLTCLGVGLVAQDTAYLINLLDKIYGLKLVCTYKLVWFLSRIR